MRRKRSNSGFAIGMVLAAVLLIAVVTTFISVTNRGNNDVSEDRLRLDATVFRSHSSDMVKAIQRIADSCPRSDAAYNACIREIRTSIRLAVPCENGTLEQRRVCPFDPLYGGVNRTSINKSIVNPANARWDMAFDVGQTGSSEKIDMVLFIDGVDQRACMALERIITSNMNAALQTGTRFPMAPFIPMNRNEGCFQFGGLARNDEIIDRKYANYSITLASMGSPKHKDVTPIDAEVGYQYYIVIPKVR